MKARNEIRSKVMAYLARREHTRAEIEAKLFRSKFPAEILKEVLDELVAQDIISNARFMADYIESRLHRGYGPNRIRAELRSKQIDGEAIDAALGEIEVDWLERAYLCYRKRYGDENIEDSRDYQKRSRFLYNKGYPSEIIRTVLKN